MILIELHRTQTPFAVIVSDNNLTGKDYSVIFKQRYIRIKDLKRLDIRWFNDNIYLFNLVLENHNGKVYEYKKFKKKMSQALKHNFLIRNQIIEGEYI